jgi:hypothetical protein
MLIVEIIVGIVIGGLILANFEAIVSLVIFAIAISVGILFFGGIGYWLHENLIFLAVSALIVCLLIVSNRYSKNSATDTSKREAFLVNQINQRKSLGYETKDMVLELETLQLERINKLANERVQKLSDEKPRPSWKMRLFGSASEKEIERRKAMGYDA